MITELKTKLTVALGAAAVSDDPATTAFMSNDVYRGGGTPAFIVRPTNLESLQSAVRICAAARIAMVPRGGGASYTDGYLLARGGHVLIDTGALDSIEVDVPNAVVTVGAGVHGLRSRAGSIRWDCAPRFGDHFRESLQQWAAASARILSAMARRLTAFRRNRSCRWTSSWHLAKC